MMMAHQHLLKSWLWYCITCGLLFADHVSCATLNDTQTLVESLFQNYNVIVRPVLDQDLSVNVTVALFVKSIETVDEVKQMFGFSAGLFLVWVDPRMSWIPGLYGGVQEITVSYSSVWVPEVLLTNPSDEITSLGKRWQKVRYTSNGTAEWIPGNHYRSDCPISVSRFPFDTQTCSVSFSPIGHTTREVTLIPLYDRVNLRLYGGNAAWDIVNTEVNSGLFANVSSELSFKIYLKRKPGFFVVNILLPVGSLCALSSFAFLLQSESGERVSFCVTVFLSIGVFLTVISDWLPRTSEPVPVISYAFMLSAVLSSATTILSILNLRLYHREEQLDVPLWLQKFYLRYLCLSKRKNKVQASTTVENLLNEGKDTANVMTVHDLMGKDKNLNDHDNNINDMQSDLTGTDEKVQVTWKKISVMIDNILFVVFTAFGLAIFAAFLITTLA